MSEGWTSYRQAEQGTERDIDGAKGPVWLNGRDVAHAALQLHIFYQEMPILPRSCYKPLQR